MRKITRGLCIGSSVILVVSLILTLIGCSGGKNTDTRGIGAVEGTPPRGMISLRSSISSGSDVDGGWEWVWICQQKDYQGNFARITVIHSAIENPSQQSAINSFNNQKQFYIDSFMTLADPKNASSQGYYDIVGQTNDPQIVGFMKYYPNLGEPKNSGEYWGKYVGKLMSFRDPNCITYAEIELNRMTKEESTLVYVDCMDLIRQIKILDN